MTGITVRLQVRSRNGRPLGEYTISVDSLVIDLKKLFHEKNSQYYPDRQWLTIGEDNKIVLKNTSRLSEYKLKDGDVVVFKDLGPQIAWRTVFLVEYFGPLFFHALCYFGSSWVYGQHVEHSTVQTTAFCLVIIHYLKREFESVHVHRFSSATMPILNIFKNSFHYWILGGISIAYFLYHPLYVAPFPSHSVTILCAALFILSEVGNLQCHITLRDLRPLNSTKRAIPHGGLFELVSCPNYTYEIMAWLSFCIFTQTLTGYVFLLVSTIQMAVWAQKKHNQYKKEFGHAYTVLKRSVLFPFIW